MALHQVLMMKQIMSLWTALADDSDLPFQLTVTEESLLTGKQIDDDYVKSSPFLRVTLHWTDHELDLYDISYLENLPEVYKSGFSAKKTRQEAVSLFSCLDAFLKEEPLGPDDM
ncbi:Ubiquitin carboxyl-terminal hydrolase 10 [Bienertia sinuspersici]